MRKLHRDMSDPGIVHARSIALRQSEIAAGVALCLQAVLLAQVSAAAAIVGAVLFMAVAWLVRRGLASSHPFGRFGPANAITLIRAAIATGLCLAVTDAERVVSDPVLAWSIVGVATVALALDGVDGWLARRCGLVSAFGARFDMEVDAGLALVLALGLIATGKTGIWVLLLGGLRYLFVVAAAFVPWLGHPLPPRKGRKTICVVQIATLVLMHAPVVAPPLSVAIALAATVALVWSFAVDVVWLWQHR